MSAEPTAEVRSTGSAGAAPDGDASRARATSASRRPSSSRPACSSTWWARPCARAPTSSPIPTARSCACAPTSPCRPAACTWRATRDGDTPARYCYSGSAFRYQPGGADRAHPREFRQAGIESFAAPDREQDDAAVLCASSSRRCARPGSRQLRLRIGDLGLFAALLDALAMPERWRRRLRHQFWRPEAFRAELARLTSGTRRLGAGPAARADRQARPGRSGRAPQALVAEHLEPGRPRADRHAHGRPRSPSACWPRPPTRARRRCRAEPPR